MRPSLFTRATHAYQPMIKFIGQRSKIPHEIHAPAPHPAAPKEVVEKFSAFMSKLQSSTSTTSSSSAQPASGSSPSSKPADYENFWEAPPQLWQIKELSDREIEAVMSGGATDIRTGP